MKVRCVTGVARELVKNDEMWFGVHSNGTRQDACTLNYSRYSRSFSPSLPRTIRCFGILFKQSSERSWHRDCLDRLENCLRVREKQVNEENGWKMKSAGKEVRKFLLHQAFVCYYFSLFFCTSIGSRVVQGLMGWKNNDNPIFEVSSRAARKRISFTLFFCQTMRRNPQWEDVVMSGFLILSASSFFSGEWWYFLYVCLKAKREGKIAALRVRMRGFYVFFRTHDKSHPGDEKLRTKRLFLLRYSAIETRSLSGEMGENEQF